MAENYLDIQQPDCLLKSKIHYYSELKKTEQKEDKFNILAQNIFTVSISILAVTWIADKYNTSGSSFYLIEKLIIFIFFYFITLYFLSPSLVIFLGKCRIVAEKTLRILTGRHSLKRQTKSIYQIGYELRGQVPVLVTFSYEIIARIPKTQQPNITRLYKIELYNSCITMQTMFQDFVHQQEKIFEKKIIDRLQAYHLLAITKELFQEIKTNEILVDLQDIDRSFDHFSRTLLSYSIN